MILELCLGALCPPLAEQLAGFSIDSEAIEQYQKDHNAIVRLSARRRPTESEKYRAQRRFVLSIQREIKRKKNRNRA